MNNRLIKSNNAGGGGGCTDTVDLYNPFPDGGGVALYQLNGDATDESGNYNGTATNVTYGTGEFGQAGVFNGSNSLVDLNGLESFFHQRQTFTVSLWFKCSTPSTSEVQLFSDYATPSFNIMLGMRGVGSGNNGKIQVAVRMNSGSDEFLTTNTYDDNQWHNVVVINNASNNLQTVYIDNIQVGTNNISTNSWVATYGDNRVTIGSVYLPQSTSYSQYFNGSIDQVRIFNRAF